MFGIIAIKMNVCISSRKFKSQLHRDLKISWPQRLWPIIFSKNTTIDRECENIVVMWCIFRVATIIFLLITDSEKQREVWHYIKQDISCISTIELSITHSISIDYVLREKKTFHYFFCNLRPNRISSRSIYVYIK